MWYLVIFIRHVEALCRKFKKNKNKQNREKSNFALILSPEYIFSFFPLCLTVWSDPLPQIWFRYQGWSYHTHRLKGYEKIDHSHNVCFKGEQGRFPGGSEMTWGSTERWLAWYFMVLEGRAEVEYSCMWAGSCLIWISHKHQMRGHLSFLINFPRCETEEEKVLEW